MATNNASELNARVQKVRDLIERTEKILKYSDENVPLRAVLVHCDAYMGPLAYHFNPHNLSDTMDDLKNNDPGMTKKLEKLEAASKILDAYFGTRDEKQSTEAKSQRIGKLFEDEQFKADISKSRSSDFVEIIKQIVTLGLINLKRMVTGRSEGERTFNRIESEIKLTKLDDTKPDKAPSSQRKP
ncbi:MAG: hypothetical protein CK426_02095 [Legionella sp.]|nr:MAG: hypothetical protein CK423_00425 [Legionella sp.]PJD99597.1 MAG: hypothetical protein CK426_02095 [Legionella sp.]